MAAKRKLIYGMGINDVAEPITNRLEDTFKIYLKWREMLRRCYSGRDSYESYYQTTVCKEWLYFSKFKAWVETQDWRGKHLDKDLLGDGDYYSPDTCIFLTGQVNSFMIVNDRNKKDKSLPTGVTFYDKTMTYRASCSNCFTHKVVSLGYFGSINEAANAWKVYKAKLAKELASIQTCEITAKALLDKYCLEGYGTSN